MPSPQVGHCIFCDDVRFEAGNKISLMGIYHADISVEQAFPIALPKFCIVVWLICDPDDVLTRITITALLPDGAEFVRIERTAAELTMSEFGRKNAVKFIFSNVIPISPLFLPNEGMLEVYVETDAGKIRVGRLWVHNASSPVPGL